MPAPVLIHPQISTEGIRQDVDLCSDERDQGRIGYLAGMERPAGIPQVTEHESQTETMVIAPPAPDHCKIRSRQRVVTNYAASISRRVEQLCDLFPGQYPSMTRWSLPPAC